jgi:hypothetical protein
MCTEDEIYTDGPTILTADDITWVERIQVLGQNLHNTAGNTSFVPGIGHAYEYGRVIRARGLQG